MLTLRLYFRRHFKAATSVPPLDHVRVSANPTFGPGRSTRYARIFFKAPRGFGMLRPLNAPEAREPRTGRQPTTTEADVRPLRLYFRRHFKAATSVPPPSS